jgi:hypothetical protein
MAGVGLHSHDLLLQVLGKEDLSSAHDGAVRDGTIRNDTPVRVNLDVDVNCALNLFPRSIRDLKHTDDFQHT